MTSYGWDCSNHDWPRGAMDLARARREGVALFTHKASEGTSFTDPYVDDAMTRGRAVFPVLGTYHVLWPQNTAAQTDHWIDVVTGSAPWWRDHPCFVWQIDAELFQNFTPYRPPTVAEINACGDRLVARLGINPERVIAYAPKWLYQDGLRGLKYQLWASAYVTGSGGFKALYPGDGNNRWGAYSGITPAILQFTSSATIAGQSPTDANAIKVGSDAALQALFLGTPGDDMAVADQIAINKHTDAALDPVINHGTYGLAHLHDQIAALRAQVLAAVGAASDPAKLAAALLPSLVAALTPLMQGGAPITKELLVEALTTVLGSVDNP